MVILSSTDEIKNNEVVVNNYRHKMLYLTENTEKETGWLCLLLHLRISILETTFRKM